MLNCNTKLTLIDTSVSCVLNYACEVWGHYAADQIEKNTFVIPKATPWR